jgi:23S rRNA (uracil1939-C5)-methyltransferase
VARRVEDVISRLLPADIVVVNPPRGGLAPAVSGCLASRPPLRLIYVSCDPATLARDLARVTLGRPDAPAPRLTSVRCFDMFPHTSQVEVLAILDCSAVGSI